jgi:hypothetical protein
VTTYLQVPVREDHLPAVYELLSALSSSTTSPPSAGSEEQTGLNEKDESLDRLMMAVTPTAREVLEGLAEQPATVELNIGQLRDATGVDHIGKGLQSISIQSNKLGITNPVVKRRDSASGKHLYSMRGSTAARIKGITQSSA